MRVEIEISDFAAETLLKEIANLPGYICDLVERDAKRVWHVQRSRPKPKEEPKPVGRPRTNVVQKACQELGETLRAIYLKQREFLGTEFEDIFGAEEQMLEEAIAANDLATLQWFMSEQPWVKRRKLARQEG